LSAADRHQRSHLRLPALIVPLIVRVTGALASSSDVVGDTIQVSFAVEYAVNLVLTPAR
jgi:hypothetical protein